MSSQQPEICANKKSPNPQPAWDDFFGEETQQLGGGFNPSEK